jgi:hypothetical protein
MATSRAPSAPVATIATGDWKMAAAPVAASRSSPPSLSDAPSATLILARLVSRPASSSAWMRAW